MEKTLNEDQVHSMTSQLESLESTKILDFCGEELPTKKMIDHLVSENKAFFRSQQINDPDITDMERRSIAENLLHESHTKFLFRFGSHLQEEHLSFFDSQRYSSNDEYEIKFLLKDIRTKLKHRARDVRNRRFMALQKMLDSTTYFSEKEMMCREPLLYEQLIGRYMTAGERRLRDGVDEDAEYSGVLLQRISNDHVSELKKKQENDELADYDSDDSASGDADDNMSHRNGIINEELFPQTPVSFRHHWGEFDVKESVTNPPVQEAARKLVPKQNYITAEEKDLLKEEFIGIMHSKFLSGEDTEFNYADVDDNMDYDDIELQSQDQEDKYFDADDDSCSGVAQTNEHATDSSEDELDVPQLFKVIKLKTLTCRK
ncbi:Coiled-coil domain-containing protein 97 [Pseudolycoriella hygida]|uniref:Coiled-coil domain-containing protein 97 n=1 Tax=Pseudolycoriella hygida TaxID=35572 RepID=A0A9Q0MWY0_9DIPT|nr:Coiled-coil domain-containing protein 97 [Pseudolycoriella hygida]